MKRIFLISFLVLCIFLLNAQKKITISGYIYDKSTGEVIIGAVVFNKQHNLNTVSNEYGFYSLTIPFLESHNIYVSYVGYQELRQNIDSKDNKLLNLYLQSDTEIDEVVVSANKKNNIVKRNETGVFHLKMKEVKLMPNLFGEVDIIKAFQLTPGVQSGGEAKSNLYVRGGSSDQNLILLDDVPMYYVAHFGGFFSVFNADAINDVKLIKGGFPARYGSRLSSILDIRMKEGNMKEFHVQGTVGLLSSKVSFEGPLIKNKLSYIVSGRKNLLPILKLMGEGLSYNFYDLNAKLNYRFSGKNKLYLSFYMGDDMLSIKNNTDISKHKVSTKWGSKLISFRWNRIYNNKLFSNITLSKTYYRYQNNFEYKTETDSTFKSLKSSLLTGIDDLSFKMDFFYIINPNIDINFGLNSIYHSFIPNDEHLYQSGTDISTIDENYLSTQKAFENSVYIENDFKFKIINANIGARFSTYNIGNTNYYSFEPRLLLNLVLRKDFSAKYSYSEMNQYVHLLTYSGTGSPADYWMPTNENVKPEKSIQHSFGIAKIFKNGMYELSLETYYKTLNNLITFIPGETLLGNLDNWEKVVEKEGIGTNYGIEFFFQKLQGKTTGWLGVTIANAERKFENINKGKAYPFKYDRLLDLSIVINHKLTKKIFLSATWTYGTGYPVTLATEHYYLSDEEQDVFIYTEKNSFKMRDYHRLDVAANFPKKTKWGERTWSLSIFNLYNRKNPYYYYYERETIAVVSQNQSQTVTYITSKLGELKLYQRSLFSIFPSISYSFKF